MAERSISERLARMPRGRHLLPADFVAQNQRSRILFATSELVAEGGYGRLTIEAIAKRARVALVTFYENFADKEECFLAAFDESVEIAAEAIGEAVDPSLPWPERLAAAIAAFLDLVESEPARARACLVESKAAGAAGLARYQELLERVAAYLDEGLEMSPEPGPVPDELGLAAAGGLAWLVEERLVEGAAEDLKGLLPEMLRATLTLYLGAEEASAVAADLTKSTEAARAAAERA